MWYKDITVKKRLKKYEMLRIFLIIDIRIALLKTQAVEQSKLDEESAYAIRRADVCILDLRASILIRSEVEQHV